MIGILDAKPKVGYFYTGRSSLYNISDKIRNVLVEDIQSVAIVLDEATSIYDALVFMFLEDVGSIYVTHEGFLTGIVSRKDFLKNAIGGLDIDKIPVGVIMSRMPNIVTIGSDENVLDAAIKIIEHEVDSLPVVEEELDKDKKRYKVVGRISKTNIVKVLVDLCRDA